MFRSLRGDLPDFRFFIYRSGFTGFSFLLLSSLETLGEDSEERCDVCTVPVVCLAEGALGGGGFFGLCKDKQMQNPFFKKV